MAKGKRSARKVTHRRRRRAAASAPSRKGCRIITKRFRAHGKTVEFKVNPCRKGKAPKSSEFHENKLVMAKAARFCVKEDFQKPGTKEFGTCIRDYFEENA